MFFGSAVNRLDEKKRFVVPKDMRQELGESFYITRGLDNCLYAMPEEELSRFREEIAAKSWVDARGVRRFFFGNMIRVTPDKQGRVLLSDDLIRIAGIDQNVMIRGADTRIEIWAEEVYNAWESDNEENVEADVIAALTAIGN